MDEVKKYEPLFGSWYVDHSIGEGSFGKVYALKKTDFGKEYMSALKIITIPQSKTEIASLRSEGMDDASIKTHIASHVASVVSEFDLMAKFRGNSNIVSLEDHLAVPHPDGFGYDILIRMELLTSLVNILERNQFTKKDVIQLGIDMCKALELCQKHNIIHRDIKPDNIFVSDHGDYKLGDFGIARTVEKTTGEMSKKGTYTYMAPEIYKGETYGSSVDIYSLGIVLYRLLNGNRTPFLPPHPAPITHSSREDALVRRMSGSQIPPPSNAEGRLAEIVMKAIAYNQMDRYESAVRMREELEAIKYTESESVLIYPQGDRVEVLPNQYTSGNIPAPQQQIPQPAGYGTPPSAPVSQPAGYGTPPQPPQPVSQPAGYPSQPVSQPAGYPSQPVSQPAGYPSQPVSQPAGYRPPQPPVSQPMGYGAQPPAYPAQPSGAVSPYQQSAGMASDSYFDRTTVDPQLGLGGGGGGGMPPGSPPAPKKNNTMLIVAIAAGAVVVILLLMWALGVFSGKTTDDEDNSISTIDDSDYKEIVIKDPTKDDEPPEGPGEEDGPPDGPDGPGEEDGPPDGPDGPGGEDGPPDGPPSGGDGTYYDSYSKIYFEYPKDWYTEELTGAQTFYNPVVAMPNENAPHFILMYNYTTEYANFLSYGGSGMNDLILDFAVRFLEDVEYNIDSITNVIPSDPWWTAENYECTKLIVESRDYYLICYMYRTPSQQVGAAVILSSSLQTLSSALGQYEDIYISFELK